MLPEQCFSEHEGIKKDVKSAEVDAAPDAWCMFELKNIKAGPVGRDGGSGFCLFNFVLFDASYHYADIH